MSILITDLAKASEVRDLTAEEMESVKGGQKADIGGWTALGEVVGTVLAPIDYDKMLEWAKQQAGK